MFGKKITLFCICIFFSVACGTEPQEITNPAGSQSQFPYLTVNESGTFFMSWMEPGESSNETLLKYSRFENERWTDPETIIEGTNWFVNWADFPSLTVADNQPLAAHWLQKIDGGTYAYNINMSLQTDNNSWDTPLSPHDDSTATEHGFASVVPWNDHSVLAIWLDGRQTEGRDDDEYFDLSKAMTLRSAIIDTTGKVSDSHEIDATVCDCCNTSLTLTDDGAIAAYRDRTEDEVRDIYVSRFNEEGWSDPVAVHNDNWNIGACPVNGPQIAAQNQTVAVAWFTGADDENKVNLAFSNDGGRSFEDPITINDNRAIGRVDLAISKNGETYVSWMEEEAQNRASINVRKLSSQQDNTEAQKVTTVSQSRKVGFPQLSLAGQQLMIAWTDVSEDEENYSVKTASLTF